MAPDAMIFIFFFLMLSFKLAFSTLFFYLRFLTVWIPTNCGKFLKEMRKSDHLICHLRNCMQVKKQQLISDMEYSVQSLSCVLLFATPWASAHQASLSITNSQSLLKLMSIMVMLVMPSNRLVLWCPHLLLPSIFPSIRIFSNESVLWIRWPKYCSFSFSVSLSNEYSGLISLKIDRLDLLVIQGTLKSLLWHHSSKAPIMD